MANPKEKDSPPQERDGRLLRILDAPESYAAVSYQEVARPLTLFAQALTGKPLRLKSLEASPQGGPKHFPLLPHTDGETIFLPEVSKDFPSRSLNYSAFKLATAHQAGYVEFGTFSFKLSMVHDLFPFELLRACLEGMSSFRKPDTPLEAFFRLFPKKSLAKDLFGLLEGARVEHCLRREYRGLKKETDHFLASALEGRPPPSALPLQEATLEFLLRTSISGGPGTGLSLPRFFPSADLWALVSPLLGKGATVRDSARTTVSLYRWVSSLNNFRSSQPVSFDPEKPFPPVEPISSSTQAMDFAPRRKEGEEPYSRLIPLPHRGWLRPELVQKKLPLRGIQALLKDLETGSPPSPEAWKDLLETELESEAETFKGSGRKVFQGLFLTEEENRKGPVGGGPEPNRKAQEGMKSERETLLCEPGDMPEEGSYDYDEWDCALQNYRVKWCRLKEKKTKGGSGAFVAQTLASYADLVRMVRRQFQMLKPERLKRIRHLERGEEIDLDAAIEAHLDRRAGRSPSEKIYLEKNRKERDLATLFLLDMSASTDQKVDGHAKMPTGCSPQREEKKVIDIEKEALVIMAEALQQIGDEYAIFGFSGYGRKGVEFYTLKDFCDPYGPEVKGRIEGIRPQRSTRMGAAIRHATRKIVGQEAKIKNLILLSDGYPQDYDYGDERGDREYALQDTMMALEEAARRKIRSFCITIDRAGHDYLRKMYPSSRYLIIEDTEALPRELPKIYRRLTT